MGGFIPTPAPARQIYQQALHPLIGNHQVIMELFGQIKAGGTRGGNDFGSRKLLFQLLFPQAASRSAGARRCHCVAR